MFWRKAVLRTVMTTALFMILMFAFNNYRGTSQDGLVMTSLGFFVGTLLAERFLYPRPNVRRRRRA